MIAATPKYNKNVNTTIVNIIKIVDAFKKKPVKLINLQHSLLELESSSKSWFEQHISLTLLHKIM